MFFNYICLPKLAASHIASSAGLGFTASPITRYGILVDFIKSSKELFALDPIAITTESTFSIN